MNQNTFVAFLRGVMPSGRNAVKMADVRAVLSDHGFNDVRTWIQSGNIILNTSLTAEAAAEHIHHLLKTALQVDLPVIIKTQTQLREALEGNPFTGAAFDIRRVFFALCNQPLSDTAGLQQLDLGSECLCIRPHCAYRKCCTQPAGQCVSGKEAWTDADHPQRQHAAENGFLLSIASFSSTVTTHACSWRALTQEVRTGKALR